MQFHGRLVLRSALLASLSQDLDFPSQFGKVFFLSQMLSSLAIPLYHYGHLLPSGYENYGVYFVADSLD